MKGNDMTELHVYRLAGNEVAISIEGQDTCVSVRVTGHTGDELAEALGRYNDPGQGAREIFRTETLTRPALRPPVR
jgi:hypothetical protein